MQPGGADNDGDVTGEITRALAGKNHQPFTNLREDGIDKVKLHPPKNEKMRKTSVFSIMTANGKKQNMQKT